MDRSYPYSRRLVSRARLRQRMAAVAATGLVGASVLCMLTWNPDPIAAVSPSHLSSPAPSLLAQTSVSASGTADRRAVRRIYPYSVVPGGVAGRAELKRVIRTDSVVAAHYASFDVDKANAVVVDKPRAVHVSYRKGDKVYWTARKVMLAPGETLLSDGSNEMRARCANRISDVPQYPVEAHQPAMEELDQAVELAEGGQDAAGPDALPVSMTGERGLAGLPGQRFPVYGSNSASGAARGPGGTTPAGSVSLRSADAGAIQTLGLSGSSSSMGSRPRPAGLPVAETPSSSPSTSTESPASPDAIADSGTGSAGGATTLVPPLDAGTGTTAPVPQPGTDTPLSPLPTLAPPQTSPVSNPLPGPAPSTPPVSTSPPALPLSPAPTLGGEKSGGGGANEVPPTLPPGAEPLPTEPAPRPSLPQAGTGQPAPTEVPEPGTVWLFGVALAALLVLRRQAPGLSRPRR